MYSLSYERVKTQTENITKYSFNFMWLNLMPGEKKLALQVTPSTLLNLPEMMYPVLSNKIP